MSWFHKSKQPSGNDEPQAYDFAKMVKVAREKDPSKFAKLQAAFKQSHSDQSKHPGEDKK